MTQPDRRVATVDEADHDGVLVLGAGPAGLSAAYCLARAERRPIVLENASFPGGLMRPITRGEFSVDIGRKELYSRIPEVHALWAELLGPNYRPYPHRVGVLYDGCIIERSRVFRGFRRGLPWRVLVPAAADYLFQRVRNPFLPPPRNEEEYWFRRRGKRFSLILSQGFKEKFWGERLRDRPAPAPSAGRGLVGRAVGRDFATGSWYHPARGSGQIIELLEQRTKECGGRCNYGARVVALGIEGTQITSVSAELEGKLRTWGAEYVVSSLPLAILAPLLGLDPPEREDGIEQGRRSTVIVYLFLDAPARFDHAWLDVTDPRMRAGRITNYAGFGGEMVPPGMACLGVEYFTVGRDAILEMKDDEIFDLALAELDRAGLIKPTRVFDHLVLRLPGAYATNDYRAWLNPEVQRLLREIRAFRNLFDVNRAGTDVATYAGLEAASAVLTGDRSRFDDRADPAKGWRVESPLED